MWSRDNDAPVRYDEVELFRVVKVARRVAASLLANHRSRAIAGMVVAKLTVTAPLLNTVSFTHGFIKHKDRFSVLNNLGPI